MLFRPLGEAAKLSASDILNSTVKVLQQSFEDFALLEGVNKVEVGGLGGAYLKATYSVASPTGEKFKVLSNMWVVLRGDYMFIISMSGPPEGPDLAEKEFAEILASIKIEK